MSGRPSEPCGVLPPGLIKNVEKLKRWFGGCWPSFHDAEVVELHYWRGEVAPGDWVDSNIFPRLTVKLRILEATQTNAAGSGSDVLATLRFHDVSDFSMKDFNHVNQIVDLSIGTEERGHFSSGGRLPPYIVVSFEPGFGMQGRFRCFGIEVLDATPVNRP